MLDKNKICLHLHELLDKIEMPISFQYSVIERMMDNSKLDMCLKIDIMEYSAKLSCFERGKIVFEKHLKNKTNIEFIMLKEMIDVYACMLAQKEAIDADGYIDIAWEDNFRKKTFSLVGEPYKTMYEKNINMFNITD